MGDTMADVKSIFGKALELRSAAERDAYLAQTYGGDSQLRAEVESLLQAESEAGGFFDELRRPPPRRLGRRRRGNRPAR